jgi:hypothetical protein
MKMARVGVLINQRRNEHLALAAFDAKPATNISPGRFPWAQ